MKLYRHYKNKLYKYIGEAKHSETLDDLVIYETLYENKLAKTWARPKKMFFDSVKVDGQSVARFQPVPLSLKEVTEVTDIHKDILAPLMKEIFGTWDAHGFNSRLNSFGKFHLIIASINERPVGFKMGYEQNKRCFYSWLGGVTSEYRGLGIASTLMKVQHEWCQKQGYARIQTKTQNRFREMLILNLKHGFDVADFIETDNAEFKIVMEKEIQ